MEGFALNAQLSSTACPRPRSTSPMAFFNWKPALSDPITIFIDGSLSHRFFCCRNHVLNREAELFQQILQRSRSPEGVHANHFSLGPNVAIPTEGGSHFNAYARRHRRRQHAFFVRRILFFK